MRLSEIATILDHHRIVYTKVKLGKVTAQDDRYPITLCSLVCDDGQVYAEYLYITEPHADRVEVAYYTDLDQSDQHRLTVVEDYEWDGED